MVRLCVSPRWNSAEPWVRGKQADLAGDGTDVLHAASVEPLAFGEDHLPHLAVFNVVHNLLHELHVLLEEVRLGECFTAGGVLRGDRAERRVGLQGLDEGIEELTVAIAALFLLQHLVGDLSEPGGRVLFDDRDQVRFQRFLDDLHLGKTDLLPDLRSADRRGT